MLHKIIKCSLGHYFLPGSWGQEVRDPFHEVFMSLWFKSHKYSCCSLLKNNDLIRSQFFTSHDISAVVTCGKFVTWSDRWNHNYSKENFHKFSIMNSKTLCEMGHRFTLNDNLENNGFIERFIDFTIFSREFITRLIPFAIFFNVFPF